MKFMMGPFYRFIRWPIFWVMCLLHWPKFIGRENVPEGAAVICPNHSGLADPVWVVHAMKTKKLPWIMAKKSVTSLPVIGAFLRSLGAFGVDRENPDLAAVKKSLRVLKDGEKLLIFPEGTRIKNGKVSQPKSGAVMLANRAGAPIVPVFITRNRKLFQQIYVIIGKPYHPELGQRPTAEELADATADMMKTVYGMEPAK